MIEYKIIEGAAIECQKWLNQWKHEYEIKVLSMSTYASGDATDGHHFVTILLTRERK